jgi:hypothetical protein
LLVTGLVHDHAVRPPQIGHAADDHLLRRANKSSVVDADQNHLLKIAFLQPRAAQALVQSHRPIDAVNAAHPVQIDF